MILKGSQRGGAKQLGLHLLKTEENEHVELHDIRGFISDNVVGALREAEAIAKGTKCRQFLFSVSLNPPQSENVRIETFETAIAKIEERNGLKGQPRLVIFHEKEGRRHAHAVWSRIDADTMTAKPLPFFKNKLRETSKELYLENGWQMLRGLMDSKARDPLNFTLAEWQQSRRIGRDAGELKGLIQECWAVSDTKASFAHALEERGLCLAKGDRRGHVAVTFEGEVISIPRATGKKSKEITARLGKPDELPSVLDTRQHISDNLLPRIKSHVDEARTHAKRQLDPLEARRIAMRDQHQAERARLDDGQRQRQESEARKRAQRMRKGFLSLWDRLTDRHGKTQKQNEMEALWALKRDREQRQALIDAQLKERLDLQAWIKQARSHHAEALRNLHYDLTNYRQLKRGNGPKQRPSKKKGRADSERACQFKKTVSRDPAERLRKLREQTPRPHHRNPRGPEIER